MTAALDILAPDSIAVVGASGDPEKLSHRPVRYLREHGYAGDVYPVNPNADSVAGFECYPDVPSLPETPELALVMLPASLVVETVTTCLEAGVGTVAVVSSGFSETGEEAGVAAERRLADLADEHGAALIGPNSQGLIDVHSGVAASFTPALEREELLAGDASVVTQSGAVGGALATILQDRGVGLNRWVSTGNEAHLGALDVVAELADDDATGVVAGYVEGFADGRRLVELKRTDAGIDLPIVLLKVGRSERGRAAAASHTGTLAGDHAVYESVFRETGVALVDDVDQLVDVVDAFATVDALPGERLGVISTSGGAGVHVADVAASEGLTLPALEGATREGIERHIPAYGSAVNPVDITAQVSGDPGAFAECLALLCEDPDLDAVVLQLTNIGGERAEPYAERIVEAWAGHDAPLFVCWTGGLGKDGAVEILEGAGVPVFENPARCVRTVAAMARFAASKPRLRSAADLPARPPEPESVDPPTDGPVLAEPAAKRLLADHGIATPGAALVGTPDEATGAADRLGYPVVAKLVSPEVPHRDRVGGVRTDLGDPESVRRACEELLALGEDLGVPVEGVSVQEQVPDGVELAAGIAGSDFGPVVMLGRGGTDVELVDDAAFRTIPVAPGQAAAMFDELRTIPALDDAAETAVVDAAVALSELYVANPWIAEADVNPLVVSSGDATAVDALIVGREATTE